MNKVIMTGRLTKDPKLSYTSSNKELTTFSIAVNRKYRNANGEYQADFFNCVTFGKVAENTAKYCKKGNLVCIEGSVENNNYEKDGKMIYSTKINCSGVEFLETNKKDLDNSVHKDFDEPTVPRYEERPSIEVNEDDLPFGG